MLQEYHNISTMMKMMFFLNTSITVDAYIVVMGTSGYRVVWSNPLVIWTVGNVSFTTFTV